MVSKKSSVNPKFGTSCIRYYTALSLYSIYFGNEQVALTNDSL